MKFLANSFIMLIPFLSLTVCSTYSARNFGSGARLDTKLYENIEVKPYIDTKSYPILPASYSLKQYSPEPEHQGKYSTCVGWAVAFSARTISESIIESRTDKDIINDNAFSPLYLYKILTNNDTNGKTPLAISEALNHMKNHGIVKRLPIEKEKEFKDVTWYLYSSSRLYPISGYYRLFNPRMEKDKKIERIKRSLYEKKPVIIGMKCPPSFFKAKDHWKPKPWERNIINYVEHAMCIVGYNDDINNGSFEVMNSWGTGWGNGGYTWINYDDLIAFASEAYEFM